MLPALRVMLSIGSPFTVDVDGFEFLIPTFKIKQPVYGPYHFDNNIGELMLII